MQLNVNMILQKTLLHNQNYFYQKQNTLCSLLHLFLGRNKPYYFPNLDYVDQKDAFLGLSYGFRIVEGVAEAASW